MPNQFILDICENIRKAAEMERQPPKERESAAEIMDGELPIGVTSKNHAAGPTESEVFDADDEDR